jgi:hypothetical protein
MAWPSRSERMEEIDIPLFRKVSEELEEDVDLGSTTSDESEFSANVGNQPLGLKLRDVFAQLKKDPPIECALYKISQKPMKIHSSNHH